jgi:hypothetical protein
MKMNVQKNLSADIFRATARSVLTIHDFCSVKSHQVQRSNAEKACRLRASVRFYLQRCV